MNDLLFSWVTPLIRRGATEPLNYDLLLPVPHNTTPKASTSALWKHWTQVSPNQQHSLLHPMTPVRQRQQLYCLPPTRVDNQLATYKNWLSKRTAAVGSEVHAPPQNPPCCRTWHQMPTRSTPAQVSRHPARGFILAPVAATNTLTTLNTG
jgi:hypothetical protein